MIGTTTTRDKSDSLSLNHSRYQRDNDLKAVRSRSVPKVFVPERTHGKPCGKSYISKDKNCKLQSSTLSLPDSIELQKHQLRVAETLRKQRGVIAYHGLGSGKTLTGINVAEEYGGATVVVPAALRENFKKELDKAEAKGQYDIYSFEEFSKKKPSLDGKLLIVDEAHRLKNSATKKTQALLDAGKGAEKVLLLTGTPIQNKPHEIAPLINLVTGENTLPLSESTFNAKYLDKVTTKPNWFETIFQQAPIIKVNQPKNLEDYYNKTSKYIDYYVPTQEGFPTVTEHTVEVPMSKQQELLYKSWQEKLPPHLQYKIKNSLPPDVKDKKDLNVFINASRQTANSGRRFNGDTEPSPKVKEVVKRIKNTRGQSLVYSNYIKSGIDGITEELDKNKVKYAVFTGAIKDKERKKMVEDYNQGKVKVLIVSSAGGEGLDLKGTRQVHILEPHWNEAKIQQVVGRAARYKSHAHLPPEKQNVNVYKYISTFSDKNSWFGTKELTVDEYLTSMGRQKQDINSKFTERWKKDSLNYKLSFFDNYIKFV